ncbi:MAG: hypothetical protein HC886_12295 [Leptolyngbyaceae cyanobacterium SM1_1_3]|nr:hypothetical protein [Leptolyngbyaceae cyanobacterium SM1_1_3]NJN01384.1 hypothetical protein [Leptolyngbyaceae cyanobacterium RM1_1_2]NJO11144.1 hypothetical protein [Leptolyngbyaceae cyanobacterium SL_1_1]
MKRYQKLSVSLALPGVLAALWALPAVAHHPFGAQTPNSSWQGLLAGLGHPVIGSDHFVFVVALGLLAALLRWGVAIPVVFVLSTVAGTGLHLAALNIPAVEMSVSASVLGLGILLAVVNRPPVGWIAGFAVLAGLFHGYAYGEAIVGAEMSPLAAYLVGFSLIQIAIAAAAYSLAQKMQRSADSDRLNLRFAGFAVAGFGAALLTSRLSG